MVRHKTYAEYLEILERFDIPVEERTTREKLQAALARELGKYTPKDIEPIWEANVKYFEELAPKGVRPVLVRYPWGEEIRFTIKGYRGLFGPTKVSELTGIKW